MPPSTSSDHGMYCRATLISSRVYCSMVPRYQVPHACNDRTILMWAAKTKARRRSLEASGTFGDNIPTGLLF